MVWWKKLAVYQVYPKSFCDSSGNGIGDLKGIISRLDYLEWLGIKAVWLSPIYRSPMCDNGYDISDYRDVDPLFGSLDDLRQLLDAMHERGMYLIMDFIPNHTSDQHEWFQKSLLDQEEYRDFYVWEDGILDAETGQRSPPTNWQTHFGGSMWTWAPKRQQYYLHHFLPEQPDLNYRHEKVGEEMNEILKFWLDFGIDGFRVDAIACLVENEDFDPSSTGPNHQHPLTFEIIRGWVDLIKDFEKESGKSIFMTTESYCHNAAEMIEYYRTGISFPFNFGLIGWNGTNTGATYLSTMISLHHSKVLSDDPSYWPNWVLSNHDQPRIGDRLNSAGSMVSSNVSNMILMLLPGTPTLYYGDELGIGPVKIPEESVVDMKGRDVARTPMPWTSEKPNGGFTAPGTKPWLPMNEDWEQRNVDRQKENPGSELNVFKRLLSMKQNDPVFADNDGRNILFIESGNEDVFMFLRLSTNAAASTSSNGYLIICHVSNRNGEETNEGFVKVPSFHITFRRRDETGDDAERLILAGQLTFDTKTPNDYELDGASDSRRIPFEKVPLQKGHGLVLKLDDCPADPADVTVNVHEQQPTMLDWIWSKCSLM